MRSPRCCHSWPPADALWSDELDGGAVAGAERVLQGHVQEAEVLQLTGATQWSGIDRPQPTVLDKVSDVGLRALVVPGDQHVEILACNLSLDQRPGECGVERLHDRHAG